MSSSSPPSTNAITATDDAAALQSPLPTPTDCHHHHQCETCTLQESRLCRYAGKKCRNPRAMKRNGSLHNLCDRHRIRANLNQRRMSYRARMKQEQHQAAVNARASSAMAGVPYESQGDWAWSRLHMQPQWHAYPAHHAPYAVPPPPPASRYAQYATPSESDEGELAEWKHSVLTANLPALDESFFTSEYPWPELPPLRSETFVWSDREQAAPAMSALPIVHSSIQAQIM